MANPSAAQRENQRRQMSRRLAMQALYQWRMTAQTAREICGQFKDDIDYPKANPEYFCLLVKEVIARHEELDEYLTDHVVRGIETLDPVGHSVLQIAAYEMAHQPSVPFKVVINEAVSLAKKFGAENSYKMVNGVVDKLVPRFRALEKSAGGN
ncbi:MAG TPA: transcription antitermination factor NusB [Gammaproteobacteria bacterium]|nr:transcription antitermination factor NusB [Gammaproteobacteria bacterium]